MKRIHHLLFVRHRHNWSLLARFGIVGASGVVINLIALHALGLLGPDYEAVLLDLPASALNVRWYHAYISGAFLVANVWNFQLNRGWTFQSSGRSSWWNEYVPFLFLGLGALAMSLAIVTSLMHPHSPIALSTDFFDDSTAVRSRLTWSNLIAVVAVTPMSFVMNKVWTFRAVRGRAELASVGETS